jgi:cytochrome P450
MTALPPGPSAPPAVQTLRWVVRPKPFMEEAWRRYGDVFTVRMTHEGDWVMLADPAHVEKVFKADPRVVHAGEANVILRPLLGAHSVLLLDDDDHMAHRKQLLAPFHGERMRRYGDLMRGTVEREIATWPRGEPIALWPRMQAVTLEVIVRAVFGVREDERVSEMRRLLGDALAWTGRPLQIAGFAVAGPRHCMRLPYIRRPAERVDAAVYEEIARRRAAGNLEQRDDILSMLLSGTAMTDAELRDELMTLLIAGHETTATALAWAIERLVRHSEALARLGEDDYLDAVCKETLRLRPVLAVVLRKLTEPMSIDGHDFAAGTILAPCIHLVHRRPDVYPDPTAFRPERFLEGQGGTYSWIPFGGGVRRCLGASFALFEMKAVLSTLVERVTLRAVDPAPEATKRRAITLGPARGATVLVS